MSEYDYWLDAPLRQLEIEERKCEAIEAIAEERGISWDEAERVLEDLKTEAMIDAWELYHD
jgi:hypothetical protein